MDLSLRWTPSLLFQFVVSIPVCSAEDLYGSSGHGERWQQLALASSHSLPVLPLSYSHFF